MNLKSIIIKVLNQIQLVITKFFYILTFLIRNILPVKKLHVNAFGTGIYDRFKAEELDKCYNHFKKHFYDAVFLDHHELKKFSITRAIENDKNKDDSYYLEFGVFKGGSINLFSEYLSPLSKKIYGFDSFEGLREDWKGHVFYPKGSLSLNKKLPDVKKNVYLNQGWIQDTLPTFLKQEKVNKINFIHIDVDTYETTKFILSQTKELMSENAVILFDDLYNFSGWSVGEYKALQEVYSEEEYKFIAFSINKGNASIQITKK